MNSTKERVENNQNRMMIWIKDLLKWKIYNLLKY